MIRLRQVKVALDNRDNLLNKVAQILRIKKEDILSYKIVKESIDARKKDNILCFISFPLCIHSFQYCYSH